MCVCVCAALLLALILVSQRSSQEEFCLTPECIEAAGSILSKMDRTVNPCQDFYTFSCGGWLKENPIPEDSSSFGIYPWLRQNVDVKLKDLRLSIGGRAEESQEVAQINGVNLFPCVHEAKLEEVDSRPLLKTLRQPEFRWPAVGDGLGGDYQWSQSQWNLLKTLAELRNLHSKSVLIRLYVSPDDKNSSHYVIKVRLLQDLRRNATLRGLHPVYMDSEALHGSSNPRVTDQIKSFFLGVNSLMLTRLCLQILIPYENRTSENMYNNYTIAQLQRLIPEFDWLGFIKAVVDSKDDPARSVSSGETVIVRAPQYFKDLMKLLNVTDPRTIANYVQWRMVFSKVTSLSRRFLYRYLDYARVTTGTTSLTPRWDKCVNYVENSLVYATGRLFVNTHFQEDKKHMMEELIDGIRWAFIDILEKENDWMDQPTKIRAVEKAHAVLAKVGYPEFILNDTYLNEDLKQVGVRVPTRLSERRSLHADAWFTNPTTVNAFYSSSTNQIRFPAGELQKPFFWGLEYPRSLSYGAIGVIVGHELTHGFDNNGRKYDKDGNLDLWWSNSSITAFNEKTQCMIDQYNGYYWEEAGLNVRGKRTLSENIADNGGIREAFRAYRRWVDESRGGEEEPLLPGVQLNNNQLFFLSYAHVRCNSYRPEAAREQIQSGAHSPPKYRVIGAMSNYEEFRKVFNCPESSPMNRGAKSCRVW
uniref:Phosphate regulating endopeptidase homolog, X-linked n=1 Tax=Salarias fasciatus TaxID=181472 RepID=A0A672GNE8_SALFA